MDCLLYRKSLGLTAVTVLTLAVPALFPVLEVAFLSPGSFLTPLTILLIFSVLFLFCYVITFIILLLIIEIFLHTSHLCTCLKSFYFISYWENLHSSFCVYLCVSFTTHTRHVTSDISGHQICGRFPPHTRQFSATPAGYPAIQLSIYLEMTSDPTS